MKKVQIKEGTNDEKIERKKLQTREFQMLKSFVMRCGRKSSRIESQAHRASKKKMKITEIFCNKMT